MYNLSIMSCCSFDLGNLNFRGRAAAITIAEQKSPPVSLRDIIAFTRDHEGAVVNNRVLIVTALFLILLGIICMSSPSKGWGAVSFTTGVGLLGFSTWASRTLDLAKREFHLAIQVKLKPTCWEKIENFFGSPNDNDL